MHYHFSTQAFAVGTMLEGRKYMRKRAQRIGQQLVDEVFEGVRKREFPAAPSLFTSLWTSSAFDPAIARKAFAEDPSLAEGVLCLVEPLANVCQVEPHWEITACRAVTQSGLKGAALEESVVNHGRRFWRPDVVHDDVSFFLCAAGARIVREVRRIRPGDLR